MPSTRATAAEFTATDFATAEDKARAVNALVSFIDKGCPRTKFTSRVYKALSLHLFGHIAEYDINGFYGSWFATPAGRARFFANMDRRRPGGPWADVERWLQDWAITSGAAERARVERDDAVETAERAELARLQAKYS